MRRHAPGHQQSHLGKYSSSYNLYQLRMLYRFVLMWLVGGVCFAHYLPQNSHTQHPPTHIIVWITPNQRIIRSQKYIYIYIHRLKTRIHTAVVVDFLQLYPSLTLSFTFPVFVEIDLWTNHSHKYGPYRDHSYYSSPPNNTQYTGGKFGIHPSIVFIL